MKYKLNNQLKKIFIFLWNFLTKLNYSIYINKKNKFEFNFNLNNLKKIKILIIKPFYYSDLIKKYPDIIQMASSKVIATFIGVTAESLSRIRKRLLT